MRVAGWPPLMWWGVWRRSSYRGLRFLEGFPEEWQADAMAAQLVAVHGDGITVVAFFPWWSTS